MRSRSLTSVSNPEKDYSRSNIFKVFKYAFVKTALYDLLCIARPMRFFSEKKILDLKASYGLILSQTTVSFRFSINEITKWPRSISSKLSSNPK